MRYVVIMVGVLGIVALAGAQPTSTTPTRGALPKLESGDTWLEFRLEGGESHRWLLSIGDGDSPLGLVPGHVHATLKDASPIRLNFTREGSNYVSSDATLKAGTLSFTAVDECTDSFAFATKVVDAHHAVVMLKLTDSPKSCSPAFAASKSRYPVAIRATGGTAQEIYVIYSDLDGYFHRFSPNSNEVLLSIPATIDYTIVARGSGFFDCAKRVKYVYKKGGAINVDSKELEIHLDPPPGTPGTPVTCDLAALPK